MRNRIVTGFSLPKALNDEVCRVSAEAGIPKSRFAELAFRTFLQTFDVRAAGAEPKTGK